MLEIDPIWHSRAGPRRRPRGQCAGVSQGVSFTETAHRRHPWAIWRRSLTGGGSGDRHRVGAQCTRIDGPPRSHPVWTSSSRRDSAAGSAREEISAAAAMETDQAGVTHPLLVPICKKRPLGRYRFSMLNPAATRPKPPGVVLGALDGDPRAVRWRQPTQVPGRRLS